MAKVVLQNLSKSYGDVLAVDDLTLEMADGKFVVLLGPSGCGKTTILNVIAGLLEPSEGAILIDDVDVRFVPAHRRNMAMVFQSYALYPHLRVYDNLAFPLRMMKFSKTKVEEKVNWAAKLLNISDLLNRKPRELSGGQRQRVALGRAMVRQPWAFLMDEPLSNLDAALRLEMRLELKKLHRHLETTTIYVTHDQVEALNMADEIALLRDGLLQQYGSPYAIYHEPANTFVAQFVGSPPMNLIPGTLMRQDGWLRFRYREFQVEPPSELLQRLEPYQDGDIILGVRPEDVVVGAPGAGDDGMPSKVLLHEPYGADQVLELSFEDLSLMARTSSVLRVEMGDQVQMGLQTDNLFFFDATTERAI
ncbi:MAG: ABC transporter ATP-binding protein [Nitrospinota bacterium]